jgi:hypothetical protein
MKLLTKKIYDKLVDNHEKQDGTKEFNVVVKLFYPTGVGTWYLTEFNPHDNVAFGLCCIHECEFGYVSVNELLEIRNMLGLRIERDVHFPFNKLTLEECRKKEIEG